MTYRIKNKVTINKLIILLAIFKLATTEASIDPVEGEKLACLLSVDGLEFDLTPLDKANTEQDYSDQNNNVHWKFCSYLPYFNAFAYVHQPSPITGKGYKTITSDHYQPDSIELILRKNNG